MDQLALLVMNAKSKRKLPKSYAYRSLMIKAEKDLGDSRSDSAITHTEVAVPARIVVSDQLRLVS